MQKATYHPSHFLSNLSQYTKELISCHDVMLIGQTAWNASLAPGPYEDWRGCINRIILSELSSRSVLELKGLHQWTNSYSELLSSNWLHPHFDSVIINDNDWWQIIHHKSFTSLSGIFPHGNSGNGELSVQTRKRLFMMLFMNWGIRLLMAFVSAGVHCVCQYWRHMFLPAAVLRLFSTPPPSLHLSFIHSQIPNLF